MLFFASVLQRLELFAKLQRTLLPFLGRLGIENGRRWRFLCLRIMRYSRISRLQGGVKPSIGEAFVCFAEKRNSHDRTVVAQRQTTSPSVTLLPNLCQVQISFQRCVYSHYAKPLPKFEVLPNFRVSQ